MNVSFVVSAFQSSQYPPQDLPEVAFAGKSNVGKSSLINVLVNRRNLARTGATPGRTQSINFFRLDNRFYLVDLPGYGYARVPKKVQASWKPLVENYLRSRTNLAAAVVILDVRREPGPADRDLLHWLAHYQIPAVVALTKADKLSRQKARTRAGKIARELTSVHPFQPILFSAKTRQGRRELWDTIDGLVRT